MGKITVGILLVNQPLSSLFLCTPFPTPPTFLPNFHFHLLPQLLLHPCSSAFPIFSSPTPQNNPCPLAFVSTCLLLWSFMICDCFQHLVHRAQGLIFHGHHPRIGCQEGRRGLVRGLVEGVCEFVEDLRGGLTNAVK